jgi:prephenate dehydrogenase
VSESALVVGTGLLGTSIGLALTKAGWAVHLKDKEQRAEQLAADLGAGRSGAPTQEPTVVVLAVPPSETSLVIRNLERTYLGSIFTDVSSVKTNVQVEVEQLDRFARFVGGHPMAGRERSGPGAARADLFDGRPWVLCPTPTTSAEALATVRSMVLTCGGVPVEMSAEQHDQAVAVVSHVPQLVASALAAQLVGTSRGELELAGQGLRDTVRIAASDPDLWADIAVGNAAALAPMLAAISEELAAAAEALRMVGETAAGLRDKSTNREDDKARSQARAAVRDIVARGRAGHARIPGKHGAPAVEYTVVPVVIPDEPGALARLFATAGDAGINIEDIAIEHSPGQPVGLVEISVAPGAAGALGSALSDLGWSVH